MGLANKVFYYHPSEKKSYIKFQRDFKKGIKKSIKKRQPLVVLCIGTDRATGDCLGPLVGHYLSSSIDCSVFGSLHQPVHALNLAKTLSHIYESFEDPFIIAIDACLGCPNHVGYITLSSLPLFPGRGVNKNLPPVGDLSITGIVNFSSTENDFMIQNTKLQLVIELASFIATGIESCITPQVSCLLL